MFSGLSILLINWNSKDDTLECLASLKAAGVQPEQVLLIDNGSTDGSLEAVRRAWGDVLPVIENISNRGYAPAVNQGIEALLEAGVEWILLLNNDTVVAPDFLSSLEAAARGRPEFRIFGPLIFYYSQPDLVWFLGEHLIPGTLLTTHAYRGRIYPAGGPEILPVDFVSGCAMLVHREVFEQVGGFDSALGMYGEEVDFIWRARQAGCRAAAVPRARMWHKVARSAGRLPPQTRFLRVRNQALFYRRYSRGLARAGLLLFSLARALFQSAGDLGRRQASLLAPLWRGWWQGWFGAPPKAAA